MMKRIYEESTCVLSWLGQPSIVPDSSLAFDFLKEFWHLFGENIQRTAQALSPDCLSSKEHFARLLRGFKNGGALDHFAESLLGITVKKDDIVKLVSCCGYFSALQQLPDFNAKADAFCELLRRPYWTRKWILQEVSVANDGLLLCGIHSIQTLNLLVTYALLAFRVDLDIEEGRSFQGDVDEYVEKILLVKYSGECMTS